MNTATENASRDAAIGYACMGWQVFPCAPRSKEPIAGSRGLLDATCDSEILGACWDATPDANVAIRCGAASGIVVLDVDRRHGGDVTLTGLEVRFGALPATVRVNTPGGFHLYFAHPGGTIGSRNGIAQGLDLKADGGYVIAPPSRHPDGGLYGFAPDFAPDDLTLAPVPDWILELVRKPAGAEVASADMIPEGRRNETLARIGGTMRRLGLSEEALARGLEDLNRNLCARPLGDREVRAIAHSLARNYEPEPGAPTPAAPARPVPIDLEAFARDGIPPVPWLFPGWIAADDVAILAGGPYTGKTTLGCDLAQSFSTGRPWCGIQPTDSGRVLVIDEEMGQRAVSRLMLRLGGPNPNLRLFSCAGFNVGTDAGLAMLEREIEDWRPGLTVFDSMTHLCAGIESENDAMLMGEVFRRVHRLREDYRTAFLIHDHRAKWGRLGMPAPSELLDLILRGSTVKGTQASAVFAMVRSDDQSANLIQAKRRENDRLLSLRIGYEAETDGPITLSGLGTPDDVLGAASRAALWIVSQAQEIGIVSRSGIMSSGVAAGHTERALERSLTDLTKSRRLERVRRGTYRLTLGGNLAEAGGSDDLL